ncbi:tyrosine-type recombinase/integrase [Lactococcus lactis]|uniref:tyrosine-type recombinase/integrase n=1 Tax=Lactococcus lactis TaxID=1358 RepID=UPI002073C493|nr:site-specific integrase [Lactococcus lactis]
MEFEMNFKDLKFTNEYDEDKKPYKSFAHFVDPITGKKRKVSVNWGTYKISNEKAAMRLLVAKVDTVIKKEIIIKTGGVQNFGQLKEKWFDSWSLTVKPQSTRTVRSIMATVIPRMISDDILLTLISPLYIQERWNEFTRGEKALQTGEPLSSSTLSKVRNILKQIFGFGVINEILEASPMQYLNLKVPKERLEMTYEKKRFKFLEGEEIDWMLEVLYEITTRENSRVEFYFDSAVFLLHTGLRIGELGALTVDDVDFENNCVYVRKNLISQGLKKEEFQTGGTKTLSSNRTVVLNPICMEIIKRRIQKNQERQEYVKIMMLDKDSSYWYPLRGFIFTDYLFQNHMGTPITPNLFTGFFNNKTSRKGGSIDDMIKERYPKFTKHITSHVFRYTHISMLAERGWQLKEIMDRVGHKDSKTTLEIYQQVTKDMRKNEEEDLKKITIGSQFLED